MTNHIPQLSKQSKRQLWRRIAYSYLLSILFRPGFLYGVLFGGSVQLFRELVFVRMVILNFLAVEVGQAPAYLLNIFIRAELIKTTLLMLMTGSFLLLIYSIYHSPKPKFRVPKVQLNPTQ